MNNMKNDPFAIDRLKKFIPFRFSQECRFEKILPATEGELRDFPSSLHPKLRQALLDDGITSLYSHQLEAYESLRTGQDTLLVSRTASGKTLSFLLPILDDYAHSDGQFSVLFLYPTKALSRDQEGTLGRMLKKMGRDGAHFGTFDGDTPREEREKLHAVGDFVITNPDMLHSGILPQHHRRWRSFLSRLKYIVVDEIHTYRGVFGSHVAQVMRRLLRICEIHGSFPSFVGLSATIGNPREQVEALFGRPFHVVEKDGAPRPERHMFFINPSLKQGAGGAYFRKGTGSISVSLLRYATENNIRTICFCRARQQVERLTRAVLQGRRDLQDKIKPYRGGLLPQERRKLEKDLFSGKICTIITTNALELGIDIGDLDFCVLSGFPGTISSLWQQAGRVGRKGRKSVIAFVAKESPVDQYLIHHPDFLWEMPIEKASLNPDNPYIFLQHLPCAASEHPLRVEEPLFSEVLLNSSKKILENQGLLAQYKDCYHYVGPNFPSRGVNLRGMTDYNVEIYCGQEVIGEIDPIGARGTLYKDAIYQHLGTKYMSMDLDLEKKLCRVEEVVVDYYTEAVWESQVVMTNEEETQDLHGAKISFGPVKVHLQPKLYKKIKEGSLENIGYGPITLDPFEYETMGVALLAPPRWEEALFRQDKRHPAAAFYGLSYLLKKVVPSFCMCDWQDVDTDTSLSEKAEQRFGSALYLFDTHEGGVGHAEKAFEMFREVLDLCQQVLDECECEYGCPSCVPSLPPGPYSEELEHFFVETNAVNECTKGLLTALREGRIVLPEVKRITRMAPILAEIPPADQELLKLTARLERASKIFKKKSERLH